MIKLRNNTENTKPTVREQDLLTTSHCDNSPEALLTNTEQISLL